MVLAPTESTYDEDSVQEGEFSDDAGVYQEDFGLAEKSIEEHMVDLQQLITSACEQSGRLSPGLNPQHHLDPLAQLREECQAMREEVAETIKAKQEIELELLQNVEKLQERISHQREEKSKLQARLIDAQQLIGQREEERERLEQDLLNSISSERSAKEHLETQIADDLGKRREEMLRKKKEIEDDWETHLGLIDELHSKSESHGQVVHELHEARERCMRHNEQVLHSALSETEGASIKRPCLSSVYSTGCQNAERKLEESGAELQLFQQQADEEKQELQARKNEQDQRIQQSCDELRDYEHFLEVIRVGQIAVNDHIEAASRNEDLEQLEFTLPAGTHPTQKEEIEDAIDTVKKLHGMVQSIDVQEYELSRLQNLCREREQQEIEAVELAQQQFESLLAEKEEAIEKKGELEARHRFLKKEHAAEKDLKKKRETEEQWRQELDQLKAQNDGLLRDLEAAQKRGWCFGSRAKSSSSSKQPSQAGMSQRGKRRDIAKGQGGVDEEKKDEHEIEANPEHEDKPAESRPGHDSMSVDEIGSSRSPQGDEQWKVHQSFCVCEVGKERWLEPGEWADLHTLEVAENITSRKEAIDALNADAHGSAGTHYLVKEDNLWWCIFKKGKKDIAVKRMQKYIADSDNDLEEEEGESKPLQSAAVVEPDDGPSELSFSLNRRDAEPQHRGKTPSEVSDSLYRKDGGRLEAHQRGKAPSEVSDSLYGRDGPQSDSQQRGKTPSEVSNSLNRRDVPRSEPQQRGKTPSEVSDSLYGRDAPRSDPQQRGNAPSEVSDSLYRRDARRPSDFSGSQGRRDAPRSQFQSVPEELSGMDGEANSDYV